MLCFLPALVVEETVVKLSQAMTLLSMVGYNGGADGAFLYGLGGLQQVPVSFSSKIKKSSDFINAPNIKQVMQQFLF